MSMTQQMISSYGESLKRERIRILSNIESLRQELAQSLSDGTEEHGLETHLSENATVTFLRERDLSIEENEERLLREIDAALGRIDAGTFGVCTTCGQQVPTERLEALPWAARCIGCQQAAGE
jgi:RNA polymerase-binding protein DksA